MYVFFLMNMLFKAQIYSNNEKFIFSVSYYDKTNRIIPIKVSSYNSTINLEKFSFTILKGKINGNQKTYLIDYIGTDALGIRASIEGEATGLIENNDYLFIHPPRIDSLSILEYNPFPLIMFPLRVGKVWSKSLIVSKDWERKDIKFGNKNTYEIKNIYKVTNNKIFTSNFGEINAYEINAEGKGNSIKTYAKFIFSPKYGFVRMEYINYDKTKIVIVLENIESDN